MKLVDLLQVLKDRGLRIEVKAGEPKLIGPKDEASPALIRVLKLREAEIMQYYRPREYLDVWGGVYVGYDPEALPCVGSFWWRYRGESDMDWKGVPGTPGEWDDPREAQVTAQSVVKEAWIDQEVNGKCWEEMRRR